MEAFKSFHLEPKKGTRIKRRTNKVEEAVFLFHDFWPFCALPYWLNLKLSNSEILTADCL
jgi:hypothetical protein